ncbi:DEAD/DEAH box helicase [Shewanella sp. SNU WT4]|uniref:DEAD/DEAH box helicase n=1 Tax=Shewanella sp. SNU WT4 TaxID=2590015 RepID=UPI001128E0EC|nr:DEAD/DEAH box helicase [Shewanella sp. SNU WT4]QDF68076.1 DEAD/DEAH box helicase [Shewanella sp. SNU WT4]
MSFASLGLSAPILKAVAEQGYQTPSPIQAQAIPAVLTGRDIMAAAQTGTGKTAGFTLPMLQLLSSGERTRGVSIRALVLTPTRELAAQISENVKQYSAYLPLKSTVVFGGVSINPQIAELRRGVDVLVATPGRLLDLQQQGAVKFDKLEILVLDEADRMLDMGFIHDIRRILKMLPPKRQNLMFSATFSDDIRELAKGLVNDPVEISVTPRNSTATTVTQWITTVDKSRKAALLTELFAVYDWTQVLVFSRTKHGANRLARYLDDHGISAAAIHGNKSQNARTQALADFKAGKVKALVATDIAARGLDIEQLPQVVNFDLPQVAEDYVHRIGRTGRAGATGHAVSLVSSEETKMLRDIEKLIRQTLTRKVFEGYEPTQEVPTGPGATSTSTKPKQSQGRGPAKPRANAEGQRRSSNANAGNGNSRTSAASKSQAPRPARAKSEGENPYANSKPQRQAEGSRSDAKPAPKANKGNFQGQRRSHSA